MTTAIVRKTPFMKQLACVLFIAFLAAGAALAADVDVSKLPPPSPRKGVTFAKDIEPLFKASCLRCHSGQRPKAGLRLDSLDHVLKGSSKDGKVIVPGDSARSKLVIAVARIDEHTAMPPKLRPPRSGHPGAGNTQPPPPPPPGEFTNLPSGGPPHGMMPPPKPLTPAEVSLVRAWIDQGAK
jgi:hypothetical protein